MEPCKFENRIITMSEDIAEVKQIVKTINGDVQATFQQFKEHEKESKVHRYRITILWFIAQGIKYALGGGFLVTIILYFLNHK